MLKLSQLLDGKDGDGISPTESSQSRQPPQSPQTTNSSAPVSPTVSVFSQKGHSRFSSSVSSLVSSSALGLSGESPSKAQLTGVKEEDALACEPREHCEPPDLEEDYFQHIDNRTSGVNDYFSFVDCSDSYDLSDVTLDLPQPSDKRRSDSSSLRGISRINSQLSTLSTKWKSKCIPDSSGSISRSRANSSASSIAANPVSSTVRLDTSLHIPPSPAANLVEGRPSVSEALPIDISRANQNDQDPSVLQATTPLLPPFMGDDPASISMSKVNSPLQSPSVADMSEEAHRSSLAMASDSRTTSLPSPPLSNKPSIASFSRPRTSTARSVSSEVPPLMLSDPRDEWAHKLGHANFVIQPEPYLPEVCDADSFRQLRANWDLARCNFAKHLVRTGEHYGITSNIYKLTEEKWEAINREWKQSYETLVIQLDISGWESLGLTKTSLHPCEQIKLPRLHDNDKFPELGDGEIVGPMSVAPACDNQGSGRTKFPKTRNFFKFFQDLLTPRS